MITEDCQYKKCTSCDIIKSITEFRKSRWGGVEPKCKSCVLKNIYKPITDEKMCNFCNTVKPLEEFHISSGRRDGRDYKCRECRNESSRKNPKPIPAKEGYKICTKCNQEKLLVEFHGKMSKYSICRDCVCTTDKRIIKASRPDYKWCAGCNTEKPKTDFYIDKKKSSGISSRCKSCCVAAVVKNGMERVKNDPSFKLLKYLRGRIRSALKYNTKSKRTMELVGCTMEQLKNHLQQTAIQNGYIDFDIESYSSKYYHIDHIIPCNSFDLSLQENQIKCFHYTNLQILTARENIAKSDNM